MTTAATDAIGLAFTHTTRYLIDRFRWGQWVRLAFVGLLAGEMGSGGSHLGVPANFSQPHARHLQSAGIFDGHSMLVAACVVIAVIAIFALLLVLLYISSRMRFVLFDSVVASECRIREYWARRAEVAFQYFVFQLVFSLAALLAVAIVLGPVLFLVSGAGWMEEPGAHLLPLVLVGLCLGLVLIAMVIAFALIHVLTKDFVVPQMALEGVSAMEGWRRLWRLMAAEKARFAAYMALKLVLSIAAGIIGAILGFVLLLIVLIPAGGAGLVAILGGAAIGLTWNALTIAIVVVAGTAALLVLISLLALMSVPFIVFFPAYSCYFFAGRYAPMNQVLGTVAVGS